MKFFFKKILPKKLLNIRHLFFAWYGAFKYKNPSKELLVIGVTGTSGKSSTIYLLRQILESAGFKVGALTTIDFYIAGKEKLNDKKMTMLGKMEIQKYLRKMVDEKCDIAIVEVTSEGVVQHRHKFINFDTVLLTNLYPEHIDSHGSFENYKQEKLKFFEYAFNTKQKILEKNNLGFTGPIKKVCVVNGNNEYAKEFLGFDFSRKYVFGLKNRNLYKAKEMEEILAEEVIIDKNGLHFSVNKNKLDIKMYGEHNVMNITAAIAVARSLNINWDKIKMATDNFSGIPGRIEFIKEAEEKGFQVIVDYAFEPVALKGLYKVVELINPRKVIHVCGATGGGRDKGRRIPIGRIVGEKADIFFVTDEDPYEEDPVEIINAVATGAEEAGMTLKKNLFKVLDRKEAIGKAIQIAKKGDLILITGKGSEQAMCVAGVKMIPWDDREIVRESINKL